MQPDEVQLHVEDRVATITIARERQRNALNYDVLKMLMRRLDETADDPNVSVVVITGAGSTFCAGGDLSAIKGGTVLAMHEGRHYFIDVLRRLLRFPKPTIARINGHALGGGLGLALACDLSVAAEDAKLGTPEINLGLFPMMIMPLIFRHAIHRKRALEMVMTGDTVRGAEARALGLVGHAVAREALDDKVAELCGKLCSKSGSTLFLGRRAYQIMSELPLDGALDYLTTMLTINTMTEDAAEGIAAFLEKRTPDWKGI
jgi:enoyl-CoA hydratase/carnithine racemase